LTHAPRKLGLCGLRSPAARRCGLTRPAGPPAWTAALNA